MTKQTAVHNYGIEYYIICVLLKQKNIYLLWYYNNPDGVLLDENGNILAFKEETDCYDFIRRSGLLLGDSDITLYDLDQIEDWINQPEEKTIEYSNFLNVWNLFDDLLVSAKKVDIATSYSRAKLSVYDKLFMGNNLPSMRPDGEYYKPVWSKAELNMLKSVMKNGFAMFRALVADRM